MKANIPNLITLLNLLCGCIAVIFAVENHLEMAAFFVFFGIFFDYLDGFAARMLKVQSDLGVQLDSLADMVTCGVVPGLVMFQLLKISSGAIWDESNFHGFLPYLGLLIPLASAYRLAKFNIDENQVSSFIGLPTPANALFILSLPLILTYQGNDFLNSILVNQWFLIAVTLVSAFMLNANIPLFALKFKDWKLRNNTTRYSFLSLSAVLLVVVHYAAIPLIIVLYVVMSVLESVAAKKP